MRFGGFSGKLVALGGAVSAAAGVQLALNAVGTNFNVPQVAQFAPLLALGTAFFAAKKLGGGTPVAILSILPFIGALGINLGGLLGGLGAAPSNGAMGDGWEG